MVASIMSSPSGSLRIILPPLLNLVGEPFSVYEITLLPLKIGASFIGSISNVTLAVLEFVIPSLDTKEILAVLTPDKLGVGVNVATSKALFIFVKLPKAVKFEEPFPEPPKFIPVLPRAKVPPVIVKVKV